MTRWKDAWTATYTEAEWANRQPPELSFESWLLDGYSDTLSTEVISHKGYIRYYPCKNVVEANDHTPEDQKKAKKKLLSCTRLSHLFESKNTLQERLYYFTTSGNDI
jgi:hypothetical protein